MSEACPRPSEILAEHRVAIIEAARQHKAGDVRVFGSVAQGQDVAGSDLDLLVRFAPDADIFDLADLIVSLEELTGLQVDVVSEDGMGPGPNRIRTKLWRCE